MLDSAEGAAERTHKETAEVPDDQPAAEKRGRLQDPEETSPAGDSVPQRALWQNKHPQQNIVAHPPADPPSYCPIILSIPSES